MPQLRQQGAADQRAVSFWADPLNVLPDEGLTIYPDGSFDVTRGGQRFHIATAVASCVDCGSVVTAHSCRRLEEQAAEPEVRTYYSIAEVVDIVWITRSGKIRLIERRRLPPPAVIEARAEETQAAITARGWDV